ncbi:MAG: hypothetical protein LBI95_01185 [Holosporales bacterium]|jgi:hypothetical protein|nr:hypothetical protein [Holosporales bacterium]
MKKAMKTILKMACGTIFALGFGQTYAIDGGGENEDYLSKQMDEFRELLKNKTKLGDVLGYHWRTITFLAPPPAFLSSEEEEKILKDKTWYSPEKFLERKKLRDNAFDGAYSNLKDFDDEDFEEEEKAETKEKGKLRSTIGRGSGWIIKDESQETAQ